METVAEDQRAFGEVVVFLSHFKALEDPRQAGKVLYPPDEILLLCVLAVLAGAETFVDIARFGEKKIDLLRRFRPFIHGTPAHDQPRRYFFVATLLRRKPQSCDASTAPPTRLGTFQAAAGLGISDHH